MDFSASTRPDPILVARPAIVFKNPTNPFMLGPLNPSTKLPIPSFKALPKSFSLSMHLTIKPEILSMAFPNASDSFILSRSFETQSPKADVISKIPPLNPNKLPTTFMIPPARSFINVTPISMTENTPLNVFLTLAAAESDNINLAVRSRTPSVILNNCCAVIGGNISRNASLIGAIILTRPLKAFLKLSIIAVLPPRSAHCLTIAFLASEVLLI